MSEAASPLAPLRPTRRGLAIAAAGALLFATLVSLGVHGFSLALWQPQLGGTEGEGVLLGTPRTIRVDDYAVILPLALAQEAHDPPFPVVNTLIGQGQNMLLPFSLPVAHPLALFRPDTWGFFLGGDTGLAWRWWSRTLGLLAIGWLLGLVVTRGDVAVSALAGVALVASPFFQFWTLRPAPVTIHAGLLVLAALGLLFAQRRGAILLSGLLAGYAATGFALVLYPPFQIPLATLGLALVAALAWAHRERLAVRSRLGWRVSALLLAAGIVAVAAAWFLTAAGDAVERMMNTAYPGRRVSLGGGRPWSGLVAANLGLPLRIDDYGPLLNACEAAGFWLLSPPLLAAALWSWRRGGQRGEMGVVALALGLVVAALAVHATTTLPGWLVRAVAWDRVPGLRSIIALGVAEVLLVAHLLARRAGQPAGGLRIALALAWGGGLALAAIPLARIVPGAPLPASLAFAAANAALAWWALAPARPWHGMAAFTAASLAVSLWFNPVARGGAEALRETPLARAVVEIDANAGGDTVWAGFGSYVMPNLFRMLGVRAVNGVHAVPQHELWAPWDPDGRSYRIYDRYAHVWLVPGPTADPVFRLRGPDGFAVQIDPGSARLAELGVTHLLVEGDAPRQRAEAGGATWLRTVGRFHLLRASAPARPDTDP